MDELYEKIYTALDMRDYIAAKKYIAMLKDYDRNEAARLMVSLYIEQGKAAEAMREWEKLAAILPTDFYTHFLQARIFFMEKRYVSACRILQAITIPQEKVSGYGERIANLLGQCYRMLGKTEEAAAAYRKAVQYANEPQLKALEYSNFLFNLHYFGEPRADFLRQSAAGFTAAVGKIANFPHDGCCHATVPLRIGYIAADFRRHVLLCFSYALLTAFNQKKFAVYVYMLGTEDEYSQYLKKRVTVWRNLQGIEACKAAQIIYADKLDILVDLAGHTKGNGLPILAYKPAPVQISGIGYFASTGLNTVDYFLGDRYLDGEDGAEGQEEFTEELIVLPYSHFCYVPLENTPLPTKPAFQRNGYVTFGSFNNFAKVTDQVLAVWSQILAQVPHSHLLLKAAVFDSSEAAEYTQKRLQKAGLPMERVECRGESHDYLREYGDIDIALDTFPYPGGGTSCDALYMGRPLLTLKGKTHGSRFGVSLLMNLGLEELIADSVQDYINRAVMLATDADLLQELQKNIRPLMEHSPLMDKALYITSVEKAYWAAVEEYRQSRHELTYREQIQEDKISNEIITLLEKKELTAAQIKWGELRKKDARCYYLQGEIAGGQENFITSDVACFKALRMAAGEDWIKGAACNRLAENARQRGRREEAASYFLQASQYKSMEQGKAAVYSNYLFNLNYTEITAEKMLKAAQGYNELFSPIRPYADWRSAHAKLRIGYISPDFCRHVVASFSQAFFRSFDRERFFVFVYADCPVDAVTEQFMKYPVSWRNVYGLTAQEKAEQIYRDEVDILVDLSGHTSHSQLPVLAYRPAPIQICGIGCFTTTGLSTVDYFLVDSYTALPKEDKYFTERLLRLPHSHLCYTPLNMRAPVRKRNGVLTLGTMNQFDKITDDMLILWGKIMQLLPKARLFLKAGALDKIYRRAEVKRRVQQAGISFDRVSLQGYTEDYWQFYESIDIALDTYPYPGGGSTCDALYMGVPVVSLYGSHHHQRFGYSLLQNSGLGELAVKNTEDYINVVVSLGKDTDKLCAMRQQLAAAFRHGFVMDEKRYLRDLETAYEMIWRGWHEPLRTNVSGNV